jgi:hypothetical protein
MIRVYIGCNQGPWWSYFLHSLPMKYLVVLAGCWWCMLKCILILDVSILSNLLVGDLRLDNCWPLTFLAHFSFTFSSIDLCVVVGLVKVVRWYILQVPIISAPPNPQPVPFWEGFYLIVQESTCLPRKWFILHCAYITVSTNILVCSTGLSITHVHHTTRHTMDNSGTHPTHILWSVRTPHIL